MDDGKIIGSNVGDIASVICSLRATKFRTGSLQDTEKDGTANPWSPSFHLASLELGNGRHWYLPTIWINHDKSQ